MLLAVHGKNYGYRELRDYADKIQDEIRTVREVGKVATSGTQSEEIWITSSLERMAQYFADPRQVGNALMQRNAIQSAGHFEADESKIPVRTTGVFNTENEIRNVLVDVSKDGHPVYIKDFADVERRYQDPTFLVRYDGNPSLLLSVEMQEGKNIVELGKRMEEVFQRLKVLLPPDVHIDIVADQPKVVEERIATLSHEFVLAIGSVIVVTMLLLPFRVAIIAAMAIPVTLCGTLGAMDALGIALHQVLHRSTHHGSRNRGRRRHRYRRQIRGTFGPKGTQKRSGLEMRQRRCCSGTCRDNHDHFFLLAAPDPHRVNRRIHHGAPHHCSHCAGHFFHRSHLLNSSAMQLLYQKRIARS